MFQKNVFGPGLLRRTRVAADRLRSAYRHGPLCRTDLVDLATKADVKAAIAEVKSEIIKWMFCTIGFQTIMVLGAVVALAGLIH